MEMLVVHPAYGRRGHGTKLAQWGLDLAKEDNVKQGVIAAEMGKNLYVKLDFQILEQIKIDGDDVVKGVEVSVMKFDPQQPTRNRCRSVRSEHIFHRSVRRYKQMDISK